MGAVPSNALGGGAPSPRSFAYPGERDVRASGAMGSPVDGLDTAAYELDPPAATDTPGGTGAHLDMDPHTQRPLPSSHSLPRQSSHAVGLMPAPAGCEGGTVRMNPTGAPSDAAAKESSLQRASAIVEATRAALRSERRGQLECVASGLVSHGDYAFMAMALKNLSDRILDHQAIAAAVAESHARATDTASAAAAAAAAAASARRARMQWPSLRETLVALLRPARARDGTPTAATARPWSPTSLISDDGGRAHTPGLAGGSLSLDELDAIAGWDEALMYFLSGAARHDAVVDARSKVMSPVEVFELFFLARARKTFRRGERGSSRRGSAQESSVSAAGGSPAPEEGLRSESAPWIPERARIEAAHLFFDQEDELVKQLMMHTLAISASYIEKFSEAVPLSIHARLNKDDYLSPSEPIVSQLVSCGLEGGGTVDEAARREYFVSMQERLRIITEVAASTNTGHTGSPPNTSLSFPSAAAAEGGGRHAPERPLSSAFRSPDEILLCIAQLSGVVSNMISPFSLCAMVALGSHMAESRTAAWQRFQLRRRRRSTALGAPPAAGAAAEGRRPHLGRRGTFENALTHTEEERLATAQRGDVYYSDTFDADSSDGLDASNEDSAAEDSGGDDGDDGDVDADNSLDAVELQRLGRFARGYCSKYVEMSSPALANLRRRFPHVFVYVMNQFEKEKAAEAWVAAVAAGGDDKALGDDGAAANAGGARLRRPAKPQVKDPLGSPTVLSVAVALLTKLIFLFAGGSNNIAADDRRAPVLRVLDGLEAGQEVAEGEEGTFPEDLGLAAALHIPALSRFTLLARALGLENDIELVKRLTGRLEELRGKAPSEKNRRQHARGVAKLEGLKKTVVHRLLGKAESCAEAWRVFFQFLGFLPVGRRCPKPLVEWIRIFPLYALSDSAKADVMFLHGILVNYATMPNGEVVATEDALRAAPRGTLPDVNVLTLNPITPEDALRSAATLLERRWNTTAEGKATGSGVAGAGGAGNPTSTGATAALAQTTYFAPTFSSPKRGTETIAGTCAGLYDRCAAASAAAFLPSVPLEQLRVVTATLATTGGGYLAGVPPLDHRLVSRTDPHVQLDRHGNMHAALAAFRSTYRRQAVLILTWRGKGPTPERVRVGDELTLRVKGLLADPGALAAPGLRTSVTPGTVLPMLATTTSSSSSVAAAAAAAAANAPATMTGPGSAKAPSVEEAMEAARRHAVVAVLAGADPAQQILVLDTPASVLAGTAASVTVTVVEHHPRNEPPVMAGAGEPYAWTNPHFPLVSAAAHGSGEDLHLDPRPFTMGLLLGNALANNSTFRVSLAPLGFRILSRVLRAERVLNATAARSSPTNSIPGESSPLNLRIPSPPPPPASRGGTFPQPRAPTRSEELASLPRRFERAVRLCPADLSLLTTVLDTSMLAWLLQDPVGCLAFFSEGLAAAAAAALPSASGHDTTQSLIKAARRFTEELTSARVLNMEADLEQLVGLTTAAVAAAAADRSGDVRFPSREPRGSATSEASSLFSASGHARDSAQGPRRANSTLFWYEVARGLGHTSVVRTPLFTQTCSRGLQRLLCGDGVAAEESDFSILRYVTLSITERVCARAYSEALFESILLCFERDLRVSEKHALLQFITGKELAKLPGIAGRSELIFVDFQTYLTDDGRDAPRAGEEEGWRPNAIIHAAASVGGAFREPRAQERAGSLISSSGVVLAATPALCDEQLARLPTALDRSSTIEIPCYWDFLLLGTDSVYAGRRVAEIAAAAEARLGRPLRESERAAMRREWCLGYRVQLADANAAWDALNDTERAELSRAFRRLLAERLRAAMAAEAEDRRTLSVGTVDTARRAFDETTTGVEGGSVTGGAGAAAGAGAGGVDDVAGAGDSAFPRASLTPSTRIPELLPANGQVAAMEGEDDALWYALPTESTVGGAACAGAKAAAPLPPRSQGKQAAETASGELDAPAALRALLFLLEEPTVGGDGTVGQQRRKSGGGVGAFFVNKSIIQDTSRSTGRPSTKGSAVDNLSGRVGGQRRRSSIFLEQARLERLGRRKDNIALWNLDEAREGQGEAGEDAREPGGEAEVRLAASFSFSQPLAHVVIEDSEAGAEGEHDSDDAHGANNAGEGELRNALLRAVGQDQVGLLELRREQKRISNLPEDSIAREAASRTRASEELSEAPVTGSYLEQCENPSYVARHRGSLLGDHITEPFRTPQAVTSPEEVGVAAAASSRPALPTLFPTALVTRSDAPHDARLTSTSSLVPMPRLPSAQGGAVSAVRTLLERRSASPSHGAMPRPVATIAPSVPATEEEATLQRLSQRASGPRLSHSPKRRWSQSLTAATEALLARPPPGSPSALSPTAMENPTTTTTTTTVPTTTGGEVDAYAYVGMNPTASIASDLDRVAAGLWPGGGLEV